MRKPISDIVKIYKEDPFSLYGNSFFKRRRKNKTWEIDVGREIVKFFGISSVVDIGCGLGHFLEGALKERAEVLGFEYGYEKAKKYIDELILPYIKFGNVMEEINCGKFDCAMSIEVAEHILPEKSEIFILNLTKSSRKYIILTAAVPGQRGFAHINLQPKDFWVENIVKNNFTYLESMGELFIGHLNNKDIYLPNYIEKNIMVFEKSGDKP